MGRVSCAVFRRSVQWGGKEADEKARGRSAPSLKEILTREYADMAGNVEEWCEDWHGENYYSLSSEDNPTGPSNGQNRVLRGGSWYFVGLSLRASARYGNTPKLWMTVNGFRLVRDVK